MKINERVSDATIDGILSGVIEGVEPTTHEIAMARELKELRNNNKSLRGELLIAHRTLMNQLAHLQQYRAAAEPVAYDQAQRDHMKDILIHKLSSNLTSAAPLVMADIHACTMALMQAGFRAAPQVTNVPEIGEIRVGRLPTMNQDEYPGLGDWWVQLRVGDDFDEVLARVYGATPQEANTRAEALANRASTAAPAVQAESILRDFYSAYGEWIKSGAPDGKPFARGAGLCANLFDYISSAALEDLHAQFVAAGLDEKLPFNASVSEYKSESGRDECHINPARIAWVRARIADSAQPAVHAERLSGNTGQVEPVTTNYTLPFDQWLSQQTGEIDVDCGCVTTEAFFHWLRVAYEAGNSPVIPDGWIPVSERMPETDGNYWGWWSESKRQGPVWFIKSEIQAQFQSSEITHWMPLPAAPKQEAE